MKNFSALAICVFLSACATSSDLPRVKSDQLSIAKERKMTLGRVVAFVDSLDDSSLPDTCTLTYTKVDDGSYHSVDVRINQATYFAIEPGKYGLSELGCGIATLRTLQPVLRKVFEVQEGQINHIATYTFGYDQVANRLWINAEAVTGLLLSQSQGSGGTQARVKFKFDFEKEIFDLDEKVICDLRIKDRKTRKQFLYPIAVNQGQEKSRAEWVDLGPGSYEVQSLNCNGHVVGPPRSNQYRIFEIVRGKKNYTIPSFGIRIEPAKQKRTKAEITFYPAQIYRSI